MIARRLFRRISSTFTIRSWNAFSRAASYTPKLQEWTQNQKLYCFHHQTQTEIFVEKRLHRLRIGTLKSSGEQLLMIPDMW